MVRSYMATCQAPIRVRGPRLALPVAGGAPFLPTPFELLLLLAPPQGVLGCPIPSLKDCPCL